jgi:hypothetical protein
MSLTVAFDLIVVSGVSFQLAILDVFGKRWKLTT